MRFTATDFRKDLFSLLDRALQGETIEVAFKGSTLKLVPARTASKLERAKRQKTLLVDPGSIVESDAGLIAEWEAAWRKSWRKL